MANWLQKILMTPTTTRKPSRLPMQSPGASHLPAHPPKSTLPAQKALPNATVIYGIGASLMFISSFSLMWNGRWLPAFLVFFLGGCLTGFALHLLKHQD